MLDGKSRVTGIALGASGNITRDWTIFANYTYLDSKLVRGQSQFCLANPGVNRPGVATCTANSPANPDPAAGSWLQQTPRHSGSLFTTYALPIGLQARLRPDLSGQVRAQRPIGHQYLYRHGAATTLATSVLNNVIYYNKDYLTHRLFASYVITGGLTFQVNVQNLTNKKYYTTVRNSLSNSWAQPGAGRQVIGSLFYSF